MPITELYKLHRPLLALGPQLNKATDLIPQGHFQGTWGSGSYSSCFTQAGAPDDATASSLQKELAI